MTVIIGKSHVPQPGVLDEDPGFDVVRRGYDREQVEQHLQQLTGKLTAADKARAEAEQRIRTVEEELRAVRARSETKPMSQDSFGFRAEKILRMAEHEAADVRGRAAKEATAVVEQARAEAERHRHEVEQKLIARSADLDQEAAKRNVAIQEREQQAQALLADAREESARIGEDAQRSADKLVAEAEVRVDQLQKRTDNEIRRRHEAAEQELRRLGSLHDGVRSDIARLHALLGAEVTAAQNPAQQPADTSRHTAQRDEGKAPSVVPPRTEAWAPGRSPR